MKINSCVQRTQIIHRTGSQARSGHDSRYLFRGISSGIERYQRFRCDERHNPVTQKMQSASTCDECDHRDVKSHTLSEREIQRSVPLYIYSQKIRHIVTLLYLSIKYKYISVTKACDSFFDRIDFSSHFRQSSNIRSKINKLDVTEAAYERFTGAGYGVSSAHPNSDVGPSAEDTRRNPSVIPMDGKLKVVCSLPPARMDFEDQSNVHSSADSPVCHDGRWDIRPQGISLEGEATREPIYLEFSTPHRPSSIPFARDTLPTVVARAAWHIGARPAGGASAGLLGALAAMLGWRV